MEIKDYLSYFDFPSVAEIISWDACNNQGVNSWTTKYDGWYRLSAMGAGGGGAAGRNATAGCLCGGGGGGGFVEKIVYLKAGDVLTMTIGTGGAGNTSGTSNVLSNGSPGGDTTINCSTRGIAMTAGGGGGGVATTSLVGTQGGGVGGIAVGGDINSTGGQGGDCLHYSGYLEAGGGGSPGNPFGPGYRGGRVIRASGGSASGGGAGAGGDGFTHTSTTATGAGGGGGGSAGKAIGYNNDAQCPGPNIMGWNYRGSGVPSLSWDNIDRSAQAAFDSLRNPFRFLTASGGFGNVHGGPGGGPSNQTYTGGIGAGGAGFTGVGGSAAIGSQAGGGSGGVAHTAACASGRGGHGLITIERVG